VAHDRTIRIGELLSKAKGSVGHGEWLPSNRLPLDWPHDRRNSITGIALGFVIYWNHRILLDLVRDDVKGTVSRVRANSVPVEALAQFITGALFGLLMWWLNGKMRLSVEEVNTLFRQLAIPVLKGRDAAT
jgi:hypothetical protein